MQILIPYQCLHFFHYENPDQVLGSVKLLLHFSSLKQRLTGQASCKNRVSLLTTTSQKNFGVETVKREGIDPKVQNNSLPTCNPTVGGGEGDRDPVSSCSHQTWKSRKGGGAHLKVSFPNHTLGSCLGAAVPSCIPMAERGTNSFTLKGGTGLTHNFEAQGEVAWFYHHTVGMIASNRGQKSPPCVNIHIGTWGQLKQNQNNQVSPLWNAVKLSSPSFILLTI